MIKVGDKVDSRWGEATILSIELCAEGHHKYGVDMPSVPADLKDRCVFDLDNDHWAYGSQIFVLETA
tara:strand:- start:510 stop:710 length:201 start_codon:yes stop_codon:yes gene_type:complete